MPQLTFYLPNSKQVLFDRVEGQSVGSGVDSGKNVDTVSHTSRNVFNNFLREIRR
jgi:hypothetical protein